MILKRYMNMKYIFLIIIIITFSSIFWSHQYLKTSIVQLHLKNTDAQPLSNLLDLMVVNYTSEDDKQRTPFEKHYFNLELSNKLLLNRNIPDTRYSSCKEKQYQIDEFKKTSIIITFYNEAKSTLLRTITSIFNRTPSTLLLEIILIDDCSTDEINVTFLEQYYKKLKYIRNFQREGLIRSRNIGVKHSSGYYVMFIDSHCEVNVNWLEPLLERLNVQPNAAISPIIDIIDAVNFKYKGSSANLKGGFDWSLHFKWIPMSQEEKEIRNDESLPFTSPSMSGGIFIIAKKWFEQLGGFDNNLEIWGGESLELSLKLWMCGGQIEIVPCSRVGHIFRKKHPYEFPLGNRFTYLKNTKRIAEGWLQDFKHFFYSLHPNARNIEINSIHETQLLREQLQCHQFSWYLQNIFQELRLPAEEHIAFGELKQGTKCLDIILNATNNVTIILNKCEKNRGRKWILHKNGNLNAEAGGCLSIIDDKVILEYCKNNSKQYWHRNGGTLVHTKSGKCLETLVGLNVGSSLCRRGAPSQLWSFSIEVENLR